VTCHMIYRRMARQNKWALQNVAAVYPGGMDQSFINRPDAISRETRYLDMLRRNLNSSILIADIRNHFKRAENPVSNLRLTHS
jgi:hypothetical protein